MHDFKTIIDLMKEQETAYSAKRETLRCNKDQSQAQSVKKCKIENNTTQKKVRYYNCNTYGRL